MTTNINILRHIEETLLVGDFVEVLYEPDPNGKKSPETSYLFDMKAQLDFGGDLDVYTGTIVGIKYNKQDQPYFYILAMERNNKIRSLNPVKGIVYSLEHRGRAKEYTGLWDNNQDFETDFYSELYYIPNHPINKGKWVK